MDALDGSVVFSRWRQCAHIYLIIGHTRVRNPNGILIGSAVFAGLMIVTDKQTDRPTVKPSVIIGCVYVGLRSTAMCGVRCKQRMQARIRHGADGYMNSIQEGQHPLTRQRDANFRLLANQWAERRLVTQWRHGCLELVSWSLTSLFSTNMAISETNGHSL